MKLESKISNDNCKMQFTSATEKTLLARCELLFFDEHKILAGTMEIDISNYDDEKGCIRINTETYCDENDCSDCHFHNTSKKYNKCMNDFIAEEIVECGGV